MEINLNPLVGIVLSLLLIGFFQGLEIAFVSANRLNIELRKKQGKRSGIILSYFVDHPGKLIGTIIVIVNLLIVIYGLLIASFLTPLWKSLQINNSYLIVSLDVIIAAVLLLLVVFVFKAIFRANNDKIITNPLIITIIQSITGTFGIISSLLINVSEKMLDIIFVKKFRNTKGTLSKIDLEQFIEQSKEKDADEQEFDTELFENALSLKEIKIRQCLIPRKEIIAVAESASMEEVKEKFIDTKLSKLIVYKDNIDNIVGYVHQLDMFKNAQSVHEVLLPIPAVPESMNASDLISKFTAERKSIAWVVDEFGGTSGIVTMEDLLEELIGDIQDEYDTEELVESQIAKDEYILSGRLELDHLTENYGLEFEENDSETLSGYIIQEHESIPTLKERIVIGKHEFEILNVSATRIETVKLRVLK